MTLTLTQHVLLVEPDKTVKQHLGFKLEEQNFIVTGVDNSLEAIELLRNPNHTVDLLVLNCINSTKYLREIGNKIPIIILSSNSAESDRVVGLELGADDYITKPFSVREFVARCKALLRRNHFSKEPEVGLHSYKELKIYPKECRVFTSNEEISLAPKEYRLLEFFMRFPYRAWDREALIIKVWGEEFLGGPKTVDVHVRWLRQKIEKDPSNPEYIITVRGFGYRFGTS